MKKIITKLFNVLNKIGKDKYQHFTIGAIIACVVTCVTSILPFPAANFISIFAVMAIALIKEFVIDGFTKADIKDFIATMLGGLVIWLSSSFIYANTI